MSISVISLIIIFLDSTKLIIFCLIKNLIHTVEVKITQLIKSLIGNELSITVLLSTAYS